MLARKLSLAALLAALAAPALAQAGLEPKTASGPLVPEAVTRVLVARGDYTLLGEGRETFEPGSRRETEVTLGAYWHVIPNLKLGAFYSRQYGLRHDEDWVVDASGSGSWANTNSRGNDILLLDASPRAVLDFLAGENWVGELKLRYQYNFFNSKQEARIRPSLTYFWLKDDAPFMTFFTDVELVYPLNFGQGSVYDSWYYLGATKQLTPSVQLGLYGAIKKMTWVSSADFFERFHQTYRVVSTNPLLGLLVIFSF